MEKLTFGVRLPVAGPLAKADAIDRVSESAVALGFSTLWVHDFIVWNRFLDRAHISTGSLEAVEAASDGPPIFYESLTNLAYLAGLTRKSTINLGIAVLCLPYRNPIVAARQVANIDVLSRGRLVLGVGVGAPKNRQNQDFEVLGISRSDKYERTGEYLKVMREIWTKDVSTFQGSYAQFGPTEFFPKPVQKPYPPVWFGGWGPKTLALLAELGDGWIPGLMPPEALPPKIDEVHRLAAEFGRGHVRFTVAIEITASIGRTRDDAHRLSDATVRSMTEGFPLSLDEAYRSALVGSAEDVRKKVKEYAAVGVSHFELKFVYPTVDQLIEQMTLFSEEVIGRIA